MASARKLKYELKNQMELNFSYMPFIKDGGLFVPTDEKFHLGEHIIIEIQFPNHTEYKEVSGRIVWITPPNSLYQIYPGIGIQFIGDNAKSIHDLVKANLDNTMDVGGYTYGMGMS